MQPPTPNREAVMKVLKAEVLGQPLYPLAIQRGLTVEKGGKLNKGWVGQTLEVLAHLSNSSLASPDGVDFELKSTKVEFKTGAWQFQETVKVTNLNPQKILGEEFETSLLWRKLSHLVLVGCQYHSPTDAVAVSVSAIDVTQPQLVQEVRSFWEDVRHLIGSGEMPDHNNLGSFSDLIQLRPTGNGKGLSVCPITNRKFSARAFYATKRLLNSLTRPTA